MCAAEHREQPQRNLALDLVRVTESAALSCSRWLGMGQKESGDAAAVKAMRVSFSSIDIRGKVVIGEGEKDKAPMLYNGEGVGTGKGPAMDVAVDPLEGTNLLATGRPNAISVVAAAPSGAFFDPKPGFYMKKLVARPETRGLLDIEAPVHHNVSMIAQALGKRIRDVTIFVLDKPRHAGLIRDIRETGARIQLHTDGDVAGAIMAAWPDSEVDALMGTGGTPEGVLAAAAVRVLGAQMQAVLDPQSEEERRCLDEAGVEIGRVLHTEDLVRSDDVFFAATGVSGGTFLPGVEFTGGGGAWTTSMVLRGKTGTVRHIRSHHRLDKLRQFSVIDYDSAA